MNETYYLRNSAGFTFEVTETSEFALLRPIDDSTTTSTKRIPIEVFRQLRRNKAFVEVTNPTNTLERVLTKTYASRYLA